MIEYIVHNLVNTHRGVVAHGCNCQGVMNSGVAKAIRTKWPHVYERYNQLVVTSVTPQHPSRELLGRVQFVSIDQGEIAEPNSLFVANMFTQDRYGYDGGRYADLDAIRQALDITMELCVGLDLPLFIPPVGCGLGGLDWEQEVGPVVYELHEKHKIDVFVCSLTSTALLSN